MGSGGVFIMNKYVQLKDGVVFAFIETDGVPENSILVEPSVDPTTLLGKKYQDGNFIDAPLTYFVDRMSGNMVLGINSTVFVSDVTGPICDETVQPFWIMDEAGNFAPPPVSEPEPLEE